MCEPAGYGWEPRPECIYWNQPSEQWCSVAVHSRYSLAARRWETTLAGVVRFQGHTEAEALGQAHQFMQKHFPNPIIKTTTQRSLITA